MAFKRTTPITALDVDSSDLPGATAISKGAVYASHIDVRDYGALGDGVADDTSALGGALAAAQAANRPLYVPKGTYNRTTPWDLRGDGLVVRTDGMRSTVIRQTTNNVAGIKVGGYSQQIEGMTVEYPSLQSSANTGANGVELYKPSWCRYGLLSVKMRWLEFDENGMRVYRAEVVGGQQGGLRHLAGIDDPRPRASERQRRRATTCPHRRRDCRGLRPSWGWLPCGVDGPGH
jgi:hypothetical protein